MLRLFETLDGAPAGPGAATSGLETTVNTLVIAESQHEAIEEQFFRPAVRAALEDGDALADTAIEQEQAGNKLLQRLEDRADATLTRRRRHAEKRRSGLSLAISAAALHQLT